MVKPSSRTTTKKTTINNNSLLLTSKKAPVAYAFRGCRSAVTREQHPKRLKKFFDFIGIEGSNVEEQGINFLQILREDPDNANELVMSYMEHLRDRVDKGEVAAGTVKTMWNPIQRFTQKHRDVKDVIDWDSLKEAMPRARDFANDRVPTKEEICKLIEYPDRRIKFLVYTMCSSGLRVGAFDYLRWKDIEPKYNEKREIIAAKITVYAGEREQYFSYITPQAYDAIKNWMDFRAMYGEKITGESSVYRNLFRISDIKRAEDLAYNKRLKGIAQQGRAEDPKKIKKKTIERLLSRAYYEQGLRSGLAEGKNRYEWKTAHGFRKFFETTVSYAGMHGLSFEILMGHKTGLVANYLRPTEDQLLAEYVKTVPALTILDNYVEVMSKEQKIQELKQQQENLEKKQEGKEKELETTRQQMEEMRAEQKRMNGLLNETLAAMAGMLRATFENAKAVTAQQKKERAEVEAQLKKLGVL